MSRGTFGATTSLVALLGLVVSGCGSEPPLPSHTLPPADERVPITQRAIAAIAFTHLPDESTSRAATYTDRKDPEGLLGADLRFGGGGEYDGDLVRVTLQPQPNPADPCRDYHDGCVELDDDTTLVWQEKVPEEDPGSVMVIRQSAGEMATVHYAGAGIGGDPREQDLPIPVEDLADVATDPWLTLRTSPDAVAEGNELEDWESDDLEYAVNDPVANTDLGLLAAYVDFGGGGVPYQDLRSSPLTEELGDGAIGGRMTIPPDNGYVYGDEQGELDILAAPDPEAWLDGDPCHSAAYRDHCGRYRGARGPVYLAWRPESGSDPGVVWVANVRDDEVVAVRLEGFPVPTTQLDVENWLDLYAFQDQFDNNERLGMVTDQEVLDEAG